MSDDNNISETKAQLEMIENALKQDPTNSDLLQLQSELKQLLALLSPDESASENKEQETSPPGSSVVQDLSKLEGQKVRAPVREGGDCSELAPWLQSRVPRECRNWSPVPDTAALT